MEDHGRGDSAERAKRHKERSLDDYKRKIYRLRLEVEQERLRCEQLRQQREKDMQQLADRLAQEKAADMDKLKQDLSKKQAEECGLLQRTFQEKEQELNSLIEANCAEIGRLKHELQRMATTEAKEALSTVHSETLSKFFRENKALKQQISDLQKKYDQKSQELKDKVLEAEQAQREAERERQKMLRESLSFRLTKLKQEQQQSDGGAAAAVAAVASHADSSKMASTDRERELQKRLNEVNGIVQKLERRLESLKEENVQFKKREEAMKPLEEKMTKLKKRNAELAVLAKKLDERNKQLQQGGLKKLQETVQSTDIEHVKKVFARQRAKDLAEHAKASLAKDRELESFKRKCFSLADSVSNESVRPGDLGDLANLIKITAKERLHLELLKSRDWEDCGSGGAQDADLGNNGRSKVATEVLRTRLDSMLAENAALSKSAEAAMQENETLRRDLQSQRAAHERESAATGGHEQQLKEQIGQNIMLQRSLDDARSQANHLRRECTELQTKLKQLEGENATITLDHEKQKQEIERLEAAALSAARSPRHSDSSNVSQSALGSATGQIAELLRENASLREDKQELLSVLEENTDLKKELRGLAAANKALKKDSEIVIELQKKIGSLLLENENIKEELRDSNLGRAKAESARALTDAQMADILREKTDVDRKYELLRLDVKQLEKECAVLRASFTSTQSMLADSIQHNEHLQQELSTEQDKLASCAAELRSYKDALESLRAELDHSRAAAAEVQQKMDAQPKSAAVRQPVCEELSALPGSWDAADVNGPVSARFICAKCGTRAEVSPIVVHGSDAQSSPSADRPSNHERESAASAGHLGLGFGSAGGGMSHRIMGISVRNSNKIYQIFIAKCMYDPLCCSTSEDRTQELTVNAGDYVLIHGEPDYGGFCEGLLLTGVRGRVPLSILEPLCDAEVEAAPSTCLSLPGEECKLSSEHLSSLSEQTVAQPPPLQSASVPNTYCSIDVLASAEVSLLPCPQNLQLERQLSNSIVISWDSADAAGCSSVAAPALVTATVPVYAYNVHVDGRFCLSVGASGKLKALVEGVRARVPHRIAVTATSSLGESDAAQCTIVIGEPPSAPTDVKLLFVGASSVTVSFLPNNSNNVHVVLLDGLIVRNLRPGICCFNLDGLSPSTEYSVTLVAVAGDLDFQLTQACSKRNEVTMLHSALQTTFLVSTKACVPDSSRQNGGQRPPEATGCSPDKQERCTGALLAQSDGKAISVNGPLGPSSSSPEKLNQQVAGQSLPSALENYECCKETICSTTQMSHRRSCSAVPGQPLPSFLCGRDFAWGSHGPPTLYVAVLDYDVGDVPASSHHASEEIALKQGQIVRVFGNRDAEGFFVAEVGSQRGFVPHSVIHQLPVDGTPECHEPLWDGRGGAGGDDNEDSRSLPGSQSSGTRSAVVVASLPARKMTALYDYDPQHCSPNIDADLELAFYAGDVITVLGDMDEDGFYQGLLNGRTGLVPSNYLQH